jgi:hypothetical protein
LPWAILDGSLREQLRRDAFSFASVGKCPSNPQDANFCGVGELRDFVAWIEVFLWVGCAIAGLLAKGNRRSFDSAEVRFAQDDRSWGGGDFRDFVAWVDFLFGGGMRCGTTEVVPCYKAFGSLVREATADPSTPLKCASLRMTGLGVGEIFATSSRGLVFCFGGVRGGTTEVVTCHFSARP